MSDKFLRTFEEGRKCVRGMSVGWSVLFFKLLIMNYSDY